MNPKNSNSLISELVELDERDHRDTEISEEIEILIAMAIAA